MLFRNKSILASTQHLRARTWSALLLIATAWTEIPSVQAQQRPERPVAPVPAPAPNAIPPLLANICPKFVLIGVPRRIKFYGAYLGGAEIEYEEEDLVFSDYQVEPDQRTMTVLVEAKREAASGRRILKFKGFEITGREPLIYVLKREDRALLQRDLVRCPAMKDEVESPDKKPAPKPE